MDFLLIALLTVLNGVFAMSELALASSRKARLLGMADDGDKGAPAPLPLPPPPPPLFGEAKEDEPTVVEEEAADEGGEGGRGGRGEEKEAETEMSEADFESDVSAGELVREEKEDAEEDEEEDE